MVSIESSMSFRIATWINFHSLPKKKVNTYMFTNLPSVVYKIQDTLFSKSGPLEGMIQHL